jgi:NADPH-ferrihemoprotein reductase
MSILETLASPTTVVTLGTTTLLLLGTTLYFLSRKSSTNNDDAIPAPSPELDAAQYPGGKLTIYYGSQTGTAQMFAEQLVHDANLAGFKATCVDLQDLMEEMGDIDEADGGAGGGNSLKVLTGSSGGRCKAVFLMATYGEGEPTDNARQFVEWMKSKAGIDNLYKLPSLDGDAVSSDLNDLDYAVFGLGNRQYEHYNNMGKFVDVALEKVGGTRIIPIGLGDDNDDLEGDFETWKDNSLWPALRRRYINEEEDGVKRLESNVMELPSCVYSVEYLKGRESNCVSAEAGEKVQTIHKHYVNAVDCKVLETRELRDPSDPGSTIHMEIDIANHTTNTIKYQTADNLGILPKNDPVIVEAVAKALGYDLNQLFDLHPANKQDSNKIEKHTLPFPTPCTVRTALERYCDLSGLPRRSDLKQLAHYARDDIDRKALLRMAAKEGKAEYKDKIVECHVGIHDIVTKLCPSIVCPLEHFIMVCPRMQPRYYTISSSSTVHPKTIHITFSVTEEAKKDGGKFKGCCSGYLERKKKGDSVRVYVRDSTFRLPKQMERPVLMIGPGTGIAPMRAILQERSYWRKAQPGINHGPNVLYFGCKNRTMDYIYRNELESFQNNGTLTELHLAFSREQAEKVYVQHLLARQSAQTYKYIHEDKASVFVCGAVLMGAAVDHTLQDILMEHGKMKREEAKGYLDKMALEGRFVQELWS